jgi:hypothetical protein
LHSGVSKGIAWLLATLIVCRLAFMLLMPATYSIDLHSWLRVIDILRAGENPYDKTQVLNWPPFWMWTLRAIGLLSDVTRISAIHLIQAVLILCECAVAATCFVILRKFFDVANPNRVLIPVLAVNPIPILQVCQHGNFDVFVGLWIVLMVFALLQFNRYKTSRYWLLACFCVGMGIFTKTIPLVLVPLLLPGFMKLRSGVRLAGIALTLLPVVLSMILIYMAAPTGVREHVLGYRSLPGYYGITGIMGLYGHNDAMLWYLNNSPWIILCYLALITTIVWRTHLSTPVQVVSATVALLVFLPTFGPGYSPTYIYWFLPLLPVYYITATRPIRVFLLAGLVIVSATYVYEYAIFGSHGAFLLQIIKDPSFRERVEPLGGRMSQVPARLPMFAWYVILNVWLIRDLMINATKNPTKPVTP